MRETSEEHWIWDGMVLDVSTQRPLLDGLLRLAHGVNAGQHPMSKPELTGLHGALRGFTRPSA